MSHSFEPKSESNSEAPDAPFAPVPAADDPRRGREVFAPTDAPFEAPAKEFVPGPYYVGVEEKMPELAERPQSHEMAKASGVKMPVDRRDFMKLFSMSSLAATASCIERPLELAVPYVNQPVDQWPGEPTYYATTCNACSASCGVMVKTREGRPTKLEGLPGHLVSRGRLCATGQGSIQGLYHPERRQKPIVRIGNRMEPSAWEDVYQHLAGKLAATTKIGIFTGGSTGSRHDFLREFLVKMGSTADRLYTYEPNALYETMTAAHQAAFGVAAIPRAELQKAKLVVGIGSDFLDIGVSPVLYTQAYTEGHSYKQGQKGRHVQLECTYTLTGARADERHPIAPGSETLATLLLARSLLDNPAAKGSAAMRAQAEQVLAQKADLLATGYERVGVPREAFDRLAGELLEAPSLVLCGGSQNFDENATSLQIAAIMVNDLIGAYGTTLQLDTGWLVPPVRPGDLKRFLAEAGELDALIVIDSNPVFTVPQSFGIAEVLQKIPTLVSMQHLPCETDLIASHVLNTNHYLESWGDEQPIAGFWSMRQPAVRALGDSRQAEDALMWLAATAKKPLGYSDYRAYLAKRWEAVYQMTAAQVPYEVFFKAVLHQGYAGKIASQAVGSVSGNLAASVQYVDAGRGGLRLIAPLDFRLRAGEYAHLPVLQEAADTLTTITWDTFVALNPGTAAKLGLKKYDVVKVEGPAGSFEGSVYPLPGLHPDAVVVPRGNGHHVDTGRVQGGHGVNPLVALARASDVVTGAPVTANQQVKITATGAIYPLAQLQKHNDIANRKDIVKQVGFATAGKNLDKQRALDTVPNLFPELPNAEYRWGMAIDLNRCTGCQACYVACTVENNVPQVGREQILMGREMNWIKIDRYFYGSVDKPEVTTMPMLCQHCNHAPCEPVCPVYATTHDTEGVNAMTYNRCIGTRYCANACPYKVRRFNWWTHRWNMIGERLQDRNPRALNPDVTIRTRGVMEKCTFCYQRVRDAKHRVKIRGTPLRDGELQVACQQTCPANAITFGNLNDPSTAVSQMRRDYRAYLALGGEPDIGEYGLKTLPNVNYMMNVSFREQDDGHHAPEGGGPHAGEAPHG